MRQVMWVQPSKCVLLLLATALAFGCSSSVVKSKYESGQASLQRPAQIFVYKFAVTLQQVKENRGLFQATMNEIEGTTTLQHEGEIAEEAQLVAAEELVKGIQKLGLPAQLVSGTTPLPKGTVGVTGQFLDMDEGNRTRRVVVGFGSGQSKVDMRIQLYGFGVDPSKSEAEIAPTKLLEFETHADSGSLPPIVSAVNAYRVRAKEMTSKNVEQAVNFMSEFFDRQGWIRKGKVKYADR
jgi:hypothetical protein